MSQTDFLGLDYSPEQPSPRQTVTLLLTDISGSTRLLQSLGDRYPDVLERSRELLRDAISRHRGSEIDSQGDALFAVFESHRDAIRAAIDIQRAFHSESWPSPAGSVCVRIGVHTGQPQLVGGSYFGLDVHRTARISAAASGGQVVLSAATRALLEEQDLPSGVRVRDIGSHRLKDLRYPEALYDLVIPGVPERFDALRSVESGPNNLPISPTTFVGRDRDLREVRALVRRPDTRLLTLTGTGGTGKTRLAIEAARELASDFPHGLFLVELAPVADPGLVATAIVQTLGLPEFGSKTPLETLEHYLSERAVLLLLDNFEHLVAATDDILRLLSHCSRLKVVVTSREALNVRLEREYAVSPLQLPDRVTASNVESLASIESVRLFVDRVRVHDHEFTVTTSNAQAVSLICMRLDGLPLALELAASWLKLFTPQSLVDQLRTSTDLLTDGPRDLARHQRTLKDAIAWSHNLLNGSEQTVFRRLSVFAGGCTADAAIAIAGHGRPPAEVVKDLGSLLRKNLVTHAAAEGSTRIGMLETIREFASRQLGLSAEEDDLRRRHAEFYLTLAERMAPGLVGREQRQFVTLLLREQDNLRAALGWAIQQSDSRMTSRLLGALLWLWIPQGQFAEGRTWAARALQQFEHLGGVREVAVMFETAGWLEVLAGNYPGALPLFERSYEIFNILPDVSDRARANVTLGVTCLVLGDARGADFSDRAVALSRSSGHKSTMALALLSGGIKHQLSGDPAQASACYEASLAAFHEADNVFWPGQLLQNLALLRLGEGDWKRAAALARQALDIGREYGYPMIRNLSLAVMGGVALAKGAATLAAQLFGAVSSSLRELGVTFEPPEHAAMQENIDITRQLLGDHAFTQAFEDGARWRDADITAAVQALTDEPSHEAALSPQLQNPPSSSERSSDRSTVPTRPAGEPR